MSDTVNAFRKRLQERLASHGIDAYSVDIGRSKESAVWILGVLLPDRSVTTLHAPVPDPCTTDEVCDDVAVRVIAHVVSDGQTSEPIEGGRGYRLRSTQTRTSTDRAQAVAAKYALKLPVQLRIAGEIEAAEQGAYERAAEWITLMVEENPKTKAQRQEEIVLLTAAKTLRDLAKKERLG